MREQPNLYTMANRISDRMVKAFERFNADLETFRKETEGGESTLYEDASPGKSRGSNSARMAN